jgi:hypothetical protein
MIEGLLWYDGNAKRGLADKVLAAAERYRAKFGRWPNCCQVHPSALEGMPAEAEEHWVQRNGTSIQVVAAPNVLKHHYWIGESEEGGDGVAEV